LRARSDASDAKAHLDQIFQAEAGGDPIEVEIWFRCREFFRTFGERRWHPHPVTLLEHSLGEVTLKNDSARYHRFKALGNGLCGQAGESLGTEGVDLIYHTGNVSAPLPIDLRSQITKILKLLK
jgi:hypothetical protein